MSTFRGKADMTVCKSAFAVAIGGEADIACCGAYEPHVLGKSGSSDPNLLFWSFIDFFVLSGTRHKTIVLSNTVPRSRRLRR